MATLIPIVPQLFEPGTGGVPTTTPVVDSWLSVIQRMTSYEHTITATFGFESCSMAFTVTLQEAVHALRNMLMRSLIVSGPEARVCWEGYCYRVEASFGGKTVSVSLDALANRVRVRYSTITGVAGFTPFATDTTSIARYGTKDAVISVGTTTYAEAVDLAAKELMNMKSVFAVSGTTIATGEPSNDISLKLDFEGWYGTLGWVLTSRTDTSSEDTGTQAIALLGTVSPGIGAINPFFSTVTSNIATTGRNVTRKIEQDTSYRQALEDRLGRGTSTNQRLAWGVYEDRKLYLAPWMGATPSVIEYRQALGDHRVFDAYMGEVAPWDVRPDAMVETIDLLDVSPVGTDADAAARFYCERVTCRVDENGTSVDLEPQASDSIDAILANMGA